MSAEEKTAVPSEEVNVEMTEPAAEPAPPPPPTPPPSPATPAAEDKLFDESLVELKKQIAGKEVNVETITVILHIAMEVVEASNLKGPAQKRLVERLVRQVIVDAPIADEKEKLLVDMVDQNIIGSIIELVVSATRGELNINAIQQVAKTCCLPFISTLVNTCRNKNA